MTAYHFDEWDYWWAGDGYTDETGSYTIVGLATGDYYVRFDDCGGNGYLAEWFHDAPDTGSATPVAVVDGEATTGIDAALAYGGSITGTLTDAGTAGPIAYLCVYAEGADGDGSGFAWTSDDGTYRIHGLRAGSYRVHFGCDFGFAQATQGEASSPVITPPPASDDYVPEWYDDAATYEQATLVPVVQGVETPGIDASLVLGGRIAGFVSDEGGEPLDEICISVYDAATGDWVDSGYAWGGDYEVSGLRGGAYKVQAYDCGGARYEDEYYDDARSLNAATVIEVALGQTTAGIDFALALLPVPDLAVAELTVEPVPLRTDAFAAPIGWVRDVTVEVGNLGDAEAGRSSLQVWVRMRGEDGIRRLGRVSLEGLQPGETLRRTFRWNGAGSAGDAVVVARICGPSGDANPRNNARTADGYVLVGGTGRGMTLAGESDAPYRCPVFFD